MDQNITASLKGNTIQHLCCLMPVLCWMTRVASPSWKKIQKKESECLVCRVAGNLCCVNCTSTDLGSSVCFELRLRVFIISCSRWQLNNRNTNKGVCIVGGGAPVRWKADKGRERVVSSSEWVRRSNWQIFSTFYFADILRYSFCIRFCSRFLTSWRGDINVEHFNIVRSKRSWQHTTNL